MLASGKREVLVVAILFALFFQLVGFVLGQDANWDQLNYHLSSTDSWLLGKPWTDYAVSQRQTWFNPLPGIPAYLVVTQLPNRLAAIALALFPVVNALAVFLIARRFVSPGRDVFALLAALACAFVGVTGTIHLTVVASTSVEAWLSGLILLGLYFLMRVAAEPSSANGKVLAVAGLCLGAAAGLKATNLIYCIGGAAAVLPVIARSSNRVAAAFAFAAAGVAGFLVAGGWWHFALWREFGDPVFPMSTGAFASSWVGPDALPPEPHAFRRSHWWQLFIDPFLLAMGDHQMPLSTVMPVRDPRYLVGFYGSIALLVRLAWRSGSARSTGQAASHAVMATFFLVSYLTWVAVFNIDRYAIPLELVCAAVAGALIVDVAPIDRRLGKIACFAVLAAMLLATKPIRTHRVPVTDDWFGMQVPQTISESDTLYVMTGFQALAWLTVHDKGLGDRPSFVRIAGNLKIDPDLPLGIRIRRAIASHRGPIRSLTAETEMGDAPAELARFGLAVAPGECLPIRTKVLPAILSCPLMELQPGQPHGAAVPEASTAAMRDLSGGERE